MSFVARIVKNLEEAGTPLTLPELAERLGGTEKTNSLKTTISRVINKPKDEKTLIERRLIRVERGVYGLSQEKDSDLGLSWHDAIVHVLKESGSPVHYRDITDEIVSRNLVTKIGLTPAQTVATNLTRNRDDLFVRVERGIYTLAERADDDEDELEEGVGEEGEDIDEEEDADFEGDAEVAVQETEAEDLLGKNGEDAEVEEIDGETGIDAEKELEKIVVFGMYWKRGGVNWANAEPTLLGVQSPNQQDAVDFGQQRGIYLLHRAHRTIYVGKALNQPLGKRLRQHTGDRLAGRWDSFSWFGFRSLKEDGTLDPFPNEFRIQADALVSLLEFCLVEAVEPALNRKAGDSIGFDEREFYQREDPIIEERMKKTWTQELVTKLSSAF